jgi:hypothetical protein
MRDLRRFFIALITTYVVCIMSDVRIVNTIYMVCTLRVQDSLMVKRLTCEAYLHT